MVNIVDIRNPSQVSFNLKQEILDGLSKPTNSKTIPTLILYDDMGLQLFDQITYVTEYYLTEAEIDILKRKAEDLVANIPDNSILVELGSGSLRKTKLLLDAIDEKRVGVEYYALDVMEQELVKSLESLGSYKNIKLIGLWGTYDDGLVYLPKLAKDRPKTLLWMGSSIGNSNRTEAEKFLANWNEALNPNDQILVGIDLRKDSQRISLAYDDPKKITQKFILNGLVNCNNNIFNQTIFNLDYFSFKSKVNEEHGYHESTYLCSKAHKVTYEDKDNNNKRYEFEFAQNEEIHVEHSYKYSKEEIDTLFKNSNLHLVQQWLDSTNSYTLNLSKKQ